MSYEHKDAAGPGAEPPVYANTAPPVNAGYPQQPQQQLQQQPQQQPQQPIQPVQYHHESFEQKSPHVQPQPNVQHPQQYQPQPGQYSNTLEPYALTSSPARIHCTHCGQQKMTRITPVTGNTTHAWALGLCCVFCLGCIPYCIGSFKDIEHHCGNCGIKVATWHRSGRTDAHM